MWRPRWSARPDGPNGVWKPIDSSGRENRQNLYGIVQGSHFNHLREKSAKDLIALDFPGYAIGGVSVGEAKEKSMTRSNSPRRFARTQTPLSHGRGHAGRPLGMRGTGIDLFDCVLPTRIARNGTALDPQGKVDLEERPIHSEGFLLVSMRMPLRMLPEL